MSGFYFPASPSRRSFRTIHSAYLPCTNFRGTRVKAWAGTDRRKSEILPWDHALNAEENHVRALAAMVARMGWWGAWTIGSSDLGYVATCAIRYVPPGEGADFDRRYSCAATLRAAVTLAAESESVIAVFDAATMRDLEGAPREDEVPL